MVIGCNNIQIEPEIKVTRIGERWHARLLIDKAVHDEMACANRQDIGWICREMLRWFCKLGGVSKFASAARKRQVTGPIGKVWHRNNLFDKHPNLWYK